MTSEGSGVAGGADIVGNGLDPGYSPPAHLSTFPPDLKVWLKGGFVIAKRLSSAQAAFLPVGFAAGLAWLTTLFPQVGQQPVVERSFFAAAAVLVVGAIALFVSATRSGRELTIEREIKTPHWLQMCAQGALMLYWGWHVNAVLGNLPLLLGQLLFAYGFDALLQWYRRDDYHIGFGPVPILLSINFFLWFRPEWYYWQFCIVALGFLAKAFIHWERDGRKRHIFNPSSFPLAVFSLVLILTGTTDTTYGLEIAQTLFNPPWIYVAVFLVTLPAQILFGVATMTIASVVTAYSWGLLYYGATGTFFFRDAFIPIAVFLGMHLLFTDPATSPRTEQGRVLYGVSYAVLTIALAALLEGVGAPTFYDKLVPIPILNLMVRRFDAMSTMRVFRELEPARVLGALGVTNTGLATASLWSMIFVGMLSVGGVGDDHPGQYLPFWAEACEAENERACRTVAQMEGVYCDRGAGWACNERGILFARTFTDAPAARTDFQRACDLGFTPGCDNVLRLATGQGSFAVGSPPIEDLPIVLRGSKGAVTTRDPEELYALGCERGWEDMCDPPPAPPRGSSGGP
ncbi:MAG: hypothetical protein OEN56_02705 [Gemmatimonadota bacterium]|nr:hypothetical protein [Gemmatimonadota bacterium]